MIRIIMIILKGKPFLIIDPKGFSGLSKDGKLTGRIFSPIVLTGYVPDLLKSVSMMGGKVQLAGGGYCGKGYKEWVKVSDGGAYMKARIRLG